MFRELYYWNIILFKQSKSNDTPAFNACIFISCLLYGNIVSVLDLFRLAYCAPISKSTATTFAITFGAFIMVFMFFYLFQQREIIIEKYDALDEKRRIRGKLFFGLYIVITVIAFIASGLIVSECNK